MLYVENCVFGDYGQFNFKAAEFSDEFLYYLLSLCIFMQLIFLIYTKYVRIFVAAGLKP